MNVGMRGEGEGGRSGGERGNSKVVCGRLCGMIVVIPPILFALLSRRHVFERVVLFSSWVFWYLLGLPFF